jgi:hypothetical protein
MFLWMTESNSEKGLIIKTNFQRARFSAKPHKAMRFDVAVVVVDVVVVDVVVVVVVVVFDRNLKPQLQIVDRNGPILIYWCGGYSS